MPLIEFISYCFYVINTAFGGRVAVGRIMVVLPISSIRVTSTLPKGFREGCCPGAIRAVVWAELRRIQDGSCE
ncbi:hypothetical protein COCSADRAFT_174157 [Bipolaris sorokiniana ND90Pr]|uniref:Uncharacterized protein n=1 Tax=Cochliobolus sativus (strain ND90Pr / ATCC 201652) TaxID=665912 RepID=M2SED4_COCSN|nr:uncharacterized protein COCSADRAFT_174157 [Bipolaris sorokiniana ND90Pr]EMD60825.1 hypothetical protein COCSADRAFT_174157 [Bipolaris sorokiniana ND90Pr]